MRAVSPETEGTAFFMGWMGEAAHKAIRTCTTVCVGLYFLMCHPALTYLQVCTTISASLRYRMRGLSEDRDRIDQPQRYAVCIRLYGSHSRGGFL